MNKNLSLLILSTLLLFSGCQQGSESQYTSESLYRTDINTVFIEMFQSQSFRRNVEYDITRAVSQQLELHSPYKVVSDRRKADTILYGNILAINERTELQQRSLDRPILNELDMVVQVTWKDLRSGELILDKHKIKVTDDYTVLLASGRKSAEKKTAESAAIRIVEAMEKPW